MGVYVVGDDRSYNQHLAEAEVERARTAMLPNVVKVHYQLADTLGLTAVHVNRTMRALKADGLIAFENRYITIPDAARLRQVCGFDPSYLHIASSADAQRTRV